MCLAGEGLCTETLNELPGKVQERHPTDLMWMTMIPCAVVGVAAYLHFNTCIDCIAARRLHFLQLCHVNPRL